MHQLRLSSIGLVSGVALAIAALNPSPSPAQQAPARGAAGVQQAPGGRFGAIAPGVEVTIPSQPDPGATFSRHDLVEVLAVDPTYSERPSAKGGSQAKSVVFERDIWALEFTFKPVRLIEVDVPDDQGRMQRKLIWYLIYKVKHTGKQAHRTVSADGTVAVESIDVAEPVHFIPHFRLESWDTGKVYPDRVIPVAVEAIQKREDAGRRIVNADKVLSGVPARLRNTIEMMGDLRPSTEDQDNSVWGVATWEDLDPTTVHFSIYVQGLTNAYRWEDAKSGEPPAYTYQAGQPAGTGRKILPKTLRLNFWRPGDQFYEHEAEFRYGYHDHPGIERFGLTEEEKVDYLWVYR